MSTPSAPALPLLTAADLPGPLDVVIGEGGIDTVEGLETVTIVFPALGKRLILDAGAVLDLARIAEGRERADPDGGDICGVLGWTGLAIELCPTPEGAIRIRPAGMARGVPAPSRWRWWTSPAA